MSLSRPNLSVFKHNTNTIQPKCSGIEPRQTDLIINNRLGASARFFKVTAGIIMAMASTFAVAIVEPPVMDNKAYVLMDYDTGEILAQKNANEPLPPASLTKMMTSHLIVQRLQSGDLNEDDMVLMSEKAWCRGSSSQSCMYVPVNESASVIDMLRGIIIQSGNDASKAMAEHIAGSEMAFADLMNAEAQRLGMTNTFFVNSTGMPAENHLASAMDLAKLAKAIIDESGEYYDIYDEESFTFNGIKQGNRNALLATDPSVDGLKTGHTNAAGYCLVASAKRNDMRLISVIMGTESMQARADQSRELLNWGFGHFDTMIVAPADQFVAKVPVWYGVKSEINVATQDTLKVLVLKTQKSAISTNIKLMDAIEAPITKGDVVGEMQAVIAGKVVASVPIVATEDVAQSGFFKRSWQHIVKWVKGLF